MFLERGFDAVTVADVAKACGVTEKTVFNHFRSKESLLIDRWPAIIEELRARVSDPSRPTTAAVVDTLDAELDELTDRGTAPAARLLAVQRFGAMVASTPALRDSRRRAMEQLIDALQEALTTRTHPAQTDAELRVAAVALSGLFEVFYRSLNHNLRGPHPDAATCRTRVRADIRRGARLLRNGLDT
jgi:AcrR family transcriptional regulator